MEGRGVEMQRKTESVRSRSGDKHDKGEASRVQTRSEGERIKSNAHGRMRRRDAYEVGSVRSRKVETQMTHQRARCRDAQEIRERAQQK